MTHDELPDSVLDLIDARYSVLRRKGLFEIVRHGCRDGEGNPVDVVVGRTADGSRGFATRRAASSVVRGLVFAQQLTVIEQIDNLSRLGFTVIPLLL